MSVDLPDIMRELAESDHRGAVWVAAQIARSVGRYWPRDDLRPRRAVKLAERWAMVRGVSPARLHEAELSVRMAIDNMRRFPAETAGMRYAAMYVAMYAVRLARNRDHHRAVALEPTLVIGDAAVHSIILGQTRPIAPTAKQLERSKPAALVAWDRTVERQPEPMRHGSLGDALSRARMLGLRWRDPVQRAIAERTPDADAVRRILEAA